MRCCLEAPDGRRPRNCTARDRAKAPVDQFRAFYERHHQREPKPPTLDLFNELYLSASE